jgi:uncharacterized membrane protein YphA (DoxX/SURF4 family)
MARTSSEILGGDYRDAVVAERRSPAYQAYQVLHVAFVVAPVIAGLDKFTHLLVNWDQYLAPAIARILPFSPSGFMLAVGVIEIAAGLLVAIKPRIGGLVVAAWMVGIIINLLIAGNYFDVALRDLGLALGAIALSRLAVDFERTVPPQRTVTP